MKREEGGGAHCACEWAMNVLVLSLRGCYNMSEQSTNCQDAIPPPPLPTPLLWVSQILSDSVSATQKMVHCSGKAGLASTAEQTVFAASSFFLQYKTQGGEVHREGFWGMPVSLWNALTLGTVLPWQTSFHGPIMFHPHGNCSPRK